MSYSWLSPLIMTATGLSTTGLGEGRPLVSLAQNVDPLKNSLLYLTQGLKRAARILAVSVQYW